MADDEKRYSSDDVATILEFFGIKLTTPHEEFAKALKTDVGDLFHTDVKALFAKVRADAEREVAQKTSVNETEADTS